MEGSKDMLESDTAPVVKVSREPVIIINGVPDLPPDFASGSQLAVRDAPGSQVDHRFGEWLEERKVRKLFGDKYYVGKVVKYDSESNWYSVVYEDGDQEDLEWHELEEILLPLDITIPLKTLVMDKFKLQNAVPDYRLKVARPRKVYAITDKVPLSQGTNVASNQMVVRAVNGQQSNNLPLPGLLQASPSNCVMSASASSAGENALVCLKPSDQPKKRGRPRKDRTISGDIQPKKRGRPPKDKSISGENSVHKRNAETVRAEKLKRENLRARGASPGTQLF